jgi:toxin YoeB
MRVRLTPGAVEDLDYWQSNDEGFADKIRQVLHKLKHQSPLPSHQVTALPLQGAQLYAVKLSAEHRLVFERLHDDIIVHQCRFHY